MEKAIDLLEELIKHALDCSQMGSSNLLLEGCFLNKEYNLLSIFVSKGEKRFKICIKTDCLSLKELK